MTLAEKFLTLLTSRRFLMALAGLLSVVFQDVLGMSTDQAHTVSQIIMVWIIGDSVNKTGVGNKTLTIKQEPT